MTLKGWKKFKYGWKKMDGSLKALRIVKYPYHRIYFVESGTWSPYGTITNSHRSKDFKTKSKALTYTKNYMRKH